MKSIYLEITNGKYAANTVALDEGDVCRVGRSAKSEVFLPDDFALAESHFLLAFDGFGGRVIDSGTQTGTFLNGTKVLAAEIEESCRIRAGETEFAVLFDDDLARNDLDTPIKRLVNFLQNQEGDLYCLLDAARDEKILGLLQKSGAKYMSLYQGQSQKQMADVAPYLIEFGENREFLEKLLRHGWGKRWCSFFVSGAGFGWLWKHFRKFLFVVNENGERVYFRFYDPSVLRTFLPASTSDELDGFFGHLAQIVTEGDSPREAVIFALSDRRLTQKAVIL